MELATLPFPACAAQASKAALEAATKSLEEERSKRAADSTTAARSAAGAARAAELERQLKSTQEQRECWGVSCVGR